MDYKKDENGKVVEIHCTYDPASKGGNSPDGRKVKGTIHWVPAPYAKKAEIRLYENIVDEELGVYNEDGSLNLNPNSLTILKECYVEPALADAKAYDVFSLYVRDISAWTQRIQKRMRSYLTVSFPSRVLISCRHRQNRDLEGTGR